MSRTSDRHRRLRAVFDAALLLEPSARANFVHHACENDPELGPEVLRLLLAHEDTRSFLDHPPELLRSAILEEEPFTGTWRFQVMRRLGAGGMGVVYEVHDRIRDDVVALKTVRATGASDLYRLKREFRSLADVVHPNLVCLYELFVDDERGYFTMEMVSGLSFVDYARDTNSPRRFQDRLVPALRQLIAGVSALHSRGRLHRDIKPSNVLVTHEGRVVILDFGLIAEPKPGQSGEATYVSGGTPAYMAPEEAAGARPSEAGDWYSIGATLYEALTGTSPFAGPLTDLLYRKITIDPLSPAELAPDVPADLSSICMGLLCRDPERRLSGPAALLQLARETVSSAVESVSAVMRNTPFVGRESQLHRLNEAFQVVTNGNAAAVCVSGPSGIGKSALVRQFLAQIAGPDEVVVLSGRCYENESVPYKALDGVVDALSRRLESIPQKDLDGLLPSDLAALTRVFPVLLQVHAIAAAQGNHKPESTDPSNVRRRAFDALRALLGHVANRRTLVIHIDDLQWADADSALLLDDLLRPPSPPTMLTLLSFRSEETAAKPFLKTMLARAGRDIWSAVSLDPLSEDEAQALIASLLPLDSVLTDEDRRRMTREGGGSPFVLEQLARYAGVDRTGSHHVATFAEMFAARLGAIPADARRFLETLAICGRPMESDLICDACGVARDRQSVVAMLRASRFIRSSGSSERIETYHNRIRDVLVADIAPDDIQRIHSRLVQALVDRRSDDFEALFEHYRGAGDSENAAIQAGLAAEKAGRALAFDRAASFYGTALALSPVFANAHAWREGLANALANAGRPADAAEAYLRAASDAGHLQRVELQRRGAEQFLIGGHIDRGLELIHTMLADMGMAAPRSPRAALLPLLWRRARIRWRGLHFVSRDVGDIDADTLLRLDTCWSATTGLLLVDMISAFAFSARHLLIALDAGEPYRLSRAMAVESVARGADPSGRTLSRKLVQLSKELAKGAGHPHAIGLSLLADGMMAIAVGEWKQALTLAEDALAILRDQCVGVTWELNMAQNLAIWALMYLGELGELSRRLPALLANARSSGNLYIATELCTRSNFFWLAADDPDEGERVTIESIEQWSHQGFHRQHYSAMLARIQTALYRGNADAAWGLLAELELVLRRSFLRRIQVIRIESLYLRARSALAMAAGHGTDRRFLSVARAGARRIANERMSWSDPIASLLNAAIAHIEGRTPVAVRYLDDAVDRFDRADMKLYAAVARRRFGALQDDARGREQTQQADEWMTAQNIKNPAAMTRMLAPGFAESPSR
jgi:serine/threonine protein kinase/tetratricopeptide (TPR) repeat protein